MCGGAVQRGGAPEKCREGWFALYATRSIAAMLSSAFPSSIMRAATMRFTNPRRNLRFQLPQQLYRFSAAAKFRHR